MSAPQNLSTSDRICKSIYRYGAMTVEQGAAKHGLVCSSMKRLRQCYANCVRDGYLHLIDGKYHLDQDVKDEYDEQRAPVENVTHGHYVKPFKQLSGYTLNPHGTRDDIPEYSKRDGFSPVTIGG